MISGGRVRRYATATFNDEDESLPPLRWAFLFLYDSKAKAEADAAELAMEGPYEWMDETSWLVAWEAEPEQRDEIRQRLLALGSGILWVDTVMPELEAPQVDGVSIKSNCYKTMGEALDAFGL